MTTNQLITKIGRQRVLTALSNVVCQGGGGSVSQTITQGVTASAPSENAVFDALALKAPLASPALTGTPTAPTQSTNDNSTKIATTAYVDGVKVTFDPLLKFTQSASNPTLASVGEASLLMSDDGTTCYAWTRNVSGTTISVRSANNALLDNWGSTTACTGLPASVSFPTVFKIGSTYYMFIKDNSQGNKIFLYSSTDRVAWTVMNGGTAAITGSSTASDNSAILYNVSVAVNGTTVYVIVEGTQSPANFPAVGFYASADISSPIFTLTGTTGQITNFQCGDIHYVPERKAIVGLVTEWTLNSNPPSNYFGATRGLLASINDDLTLPESWNKTDMSFASIETPFGLLLAADYSLVLTPGKTYPSLLFYNYNQSTGYQAYGKTISSYLDLYHAIGTPVSNGSGTLLRQPSYDRLSIGFDGGNAAAKLNVFSATAGLPHIMLSRTTATSLNYGDAFLGTAGSSNFAWSAGAYLDPTTGLFKAVRSVNATAGYANNGNIDFFSWAATITTTYTPGTSPMLSRFRVGASFLTSYSYSLSNTTPTVASEAGLRLENVTAATVGTTVQRSGGLTFRGSAWKSNATAESRFADFNIDVLPVTGAASTTANLVFKQSINGAAYTDAMRLRSDGGLDVSETGSFSGTQAGITYNGALSNMFRLLASASLIYNVTTNGAIVHNRSNAGASSVSGYKYTSTALTSLPTGTEFVDLLYDTSATYAWAGSTTIAEQAIVKFKTPTYSAGSATTMTIGATVEIEGAPIAAGSMSISASYALYVKAGSTFFGGPIVLGASSNTVNTVTATSPNRTITMVIGGTTYYIHAKTTND